MERSPTSTSRRADLGAALGIIVLAFLVHIPSIGGGFIWDDDDHFMIDRLVMAEDGWWRIWLDPEPRQVSGPRGAIVWNYWPLTRTSFWIERRLWGLEPLGYHLVNAALHAVNAVLVGVALRQLRIRGAWVAAALFAVHPVTVCTLAWITQRKALLSTAFYLLALVAFLRYRDRQRAGWYVAATVAFLLALLSKTTTVMLPVTLLLLHWYQRRSWTRRTVLEFAPLFLLSAVMAAVSIIYERFFIGSSGVNWSAGVAERLARAGQIAGFYIATILWPVGLAFNYPRWPVDASRLWHYLPSLAWLAAIAVFWCRRQSWGRPLLLGLGFFLINLFPVLGFFNIYGMRYAHVSDHWQYTACIGVIALLAVALTAAPERLSARCAPAGRTALRAVSGIATLIVLCGCSVLSWQQGYAFRDLETLWRHTLQREPDSWLAHNNLGAIYMERQQWSAALPHFQRAIAAEPTYSEAYVNLGNVLVSLRDDWDAAGEYWKAATELDPSNAQAHYLLGLVHERRGALAEALACWQAATEARPNYFLAERAAGTAHFRMGQWGEAIPHLERALALQPSQAGLRTVLAQAYSRTGAYRSAITLLRDGLRQEGQAVVLIRLLAWTLATCPEAELRDGAEAVTWAEQACALTRYEDPEALDTLAAALAEAGRFDEAVAASQRALELARSTQRLNLLRGIAARRALYQQTRPYHEPDSAGPR